jgi:hypothetical protein
MPRLRQGVRVAHAGAHQRTLTKSHLLQLGVLAVALLSVLGAAAWAQDAPPKYSADVPSYIGD